MKKNKKDRQPGTLKKNNTEAHPMPKEQPAMVRHVHMGPLPDPATLHAYNQIIPDGANRIMKMAEKEQDLHRMGLIKQFRAVGWGQFVTLVIMLALIGSGIFLAIHDNVWLASLVLGTPLIVTAKALWNHSIFSTPGKGAKKSGSN